MYHWAICYRDGKLHISPSFRNFDDCYEDYCGAMVLENTIDLVVCQWRGVFSKGELQSNLERFFKGQFVR